MPVARQLVPLIEILTPQTHSGQCPSSPQPHRGLQDRQCQFDLMDAIDSVLTVRYSRLVKQATGTTILDGKYVFSVSETRLDTDCIFLYLNFQGAFPYASVFFCI